MEVLSVTEYAKSINQTRSSVLKQIKLNKLPSNVSASKVGTTWVITVEK